MSFLNFASSAFSANPQTGTAFGGGLDLGKAAGIGGKTGGSNMFGPMMMAGQLGLGVANLFMQNRRGQDQMNLQADMAKAQIAAAQDRLAKEIQLSREMGKFQEGSKIGSRVAQFGYGADLDFGRQLQAGRIQRGEFADMDQANRNRSMRNMRDFELSGLTRNVRDEESRRKMKESLAKSLAAGRGMFGPIAPVNVSDMVI
jgi:hypothetical protein